MEFPVQQFPILTPGQMNPYNQAFTAGLDAYTNVSKAAYLQPALQQELLKMQLANQISAAQAKYADPMQQALLKAQQMQPGLIQAQTGLYGAEASAVPSEISLRQAQAQQAAAAAGLTRTQAGLLGQETPYILQQQAGKVFTDPLMQRLYEMGVDPSLLRQIGINQPNYSAGNYNPSPSQGMPVGNQPAPQNQPGYQMPTQGTAGVPYSQAGGGSSLAQMFGGGNPGGQGSPAISPNLYNGTPLQNFALFGSPLSLFQQQQIKANQTELDTIAKNQATSYQKYKDQTSSEADTSKTMENSLDQYSVNYDKASYKGPREGTFPTTGWKAPPGNLTAEQQVDNASQNLQVQMAQLAAKAGGGRLTNFITQLAAQLKVGRTLTPEAKAQLVPQIQAVLDQQQEKPAFVNAISQYTKDPNVQQAIWNEYRNQRPPVNYNTSKRNIQYQGTWKDYATPQAVQAQMNGVPYVPNPQKLTKQDLTYLSPQELMAVRHELIGA